MNKIPLLEIKMRPRARTQFWKPDFENAKAPTSQQKKKSFIHQLTTRIHTYIYTHKDLPVWNPWHFKFQIFTTPYCQTS